MILQNADTILIKEPGIKPWDIVNESALLTAVNERWFKYWLWTRFNNFDEIV